MATSPKAGGKCDEDETFFYSEYHTNNHHNNEESQSQSQQLTQQAMFPESDPSEQERFAWNAMRSPVMRQRQRAKLVHVKYGVIPLSNGSLSIGRSKQADVTIQPLSHSDPGRFVYGNVCWITNYVCPVSNGSCYLFVCLIV